jgi:hypothetical protein
MLTPWKRSSQQIAITALSVAMLTTVGTARASAANLKTFNISGSFEDTNSKIIESPLYEAYTNFDLVNGSFIGSYTIDVDQVPNDRSQVYFTDWNVIFRYSSGVTVTMFTNDAYSSLYGFGYLGSYRSLEFISFSSIYNPYVFLRLVINSDLSPRTVNVSRSAIPYLFPEEAENGVPVYGFHQQLFNRYQPGREVFVTSFNSEPVPEPHTLGGIAVVGAMGLLLKRRKQKARAVSLR